MGLEDFILPFAAPLYLSELNFIARNMGSDLKKSSIVRACKFLFDAVRLNGAVSDGSVTEFWSILSNPNSKLVIDYTKAYIRLGGLHHSVIEFYRCKFVTFSADHCVSAVRLSDMQLSAST